MNEIVADTPELQQQFYRSARTQNQQQRLRISGEPSAPWLKITDRFQDKTAYSTKH